MLTKLLQSCLTLCNPTDYSPPGSSIHGILQARILEWVAMPSSRGPSRPRDWTCISSVDLRWQAGSALWAPPGKPQCLRGCRIIYLDEFTFLWTEPTLMSSDKAGPVRGPSSSLPLSPSCNVGRAEGQYPVLRLVRQMGCRGSWLEISGKHLNLIRVPAQLSNTSHWGDKEMKAHLWLGKMKAPMIKQMCTIS